MGAHQFKAFTVVYSMEALAAERRLPSPLREKVRRRCERLAELAEAQAVPNAPAGSDGLQAIVDDVRIVYESRPDAGALHVLRIDPL